jgi:Na+-transporting methylmalonyl-CoA/oxaloacetate decarboxylase gamma subunit
MANMEGNDKVISGKRFLPIFGVGIIVFMFLGIAVTWVIGQLALPLFERKGKPAASASSTAPDPSPRDSR